MSPPPPLQVQLAQSADTLSEKQVNKTHQLTVHAAHNIGCHLLTAELCNTLAHRGDEGSMRIAQVGIELLLVMGGEVDPVTPQPQIRIALIMTTHKTIS